MSGKTIYLFVSLVSIVAVANGYVNYPGYYGDSYKKPNVTSESTSSHLLIVGNRAYGDHCVSEHFVKDFSWFWGIVTQEKTYKVGKYERITQIKACDKSTKGKGARAILTQGGPGYSTAAIKFTSERGHGIDYEVEICAKF